MNEHMWALFGKIIGILGLMGFTCDVLSWLMNSVYKFWANTSSGLKLIREVRRAVRARDKRNWSLPEVAKATIPFPVGVHDGPMIYKSREREDPIKLRRKVIDEPVHSKKQSRPRKTSAKKQKTHLATSTSKRHT